MVTNKVGIPILIILGYILISIDLNAFHTIIVANMIAFLVLLMNWHDYHSYKEQPYVIKVWLQCVAIAVVGFFVTLMILLAGIIFGTYQP